MRPSIPALPALGEASREAGGLAGSGSSSGGNGTVVREAGGFADDRQREQRLESSTEGAKNLREAGGLAEGTGDQGKTSTRLGSLGGDSQLVSSRTHRDILESHRVRGRAVVGSPLRLMAPVDERQDAPRERRSRSPDSMSLRGHQGSADGSGKANSRPSSMSKRLGRDPQPYQQRTPRPRPLALGDSRSPTSPASANWPSQRDGVLAIFFKIHF